uniref:Uncharacterized protein n=1 Tax=Avena sativa TaxID=4498 RepID=A0ACD5YRE2_AVESA
MGTPETKEAPAPTVQTPPAPSPEKASKPTTLLDVYEVEWITRELERLLLRDSGADARARHHRRKTAKVKAVSPVRSREPQSQARKGGFLSGLLGKHAASICGGEDAGAVASGRRRRRGRAGLREVDKV